jgi:dolichyl-phosphate beta-glucosyltransferase
MIIGNSEEHGSFDLEAISLVVPVFNEEWRPQQNADALIGFIKEQAPGSQLIVVDDGSTDNTVQVASALRLDESSRAALIARPHLGKGAAVEVGLRSAVTSLAGYTDVDLPTPLHEIARLIRIAASTNALVIGSRGKPETKIGTHQARRQELLGKLFNLWVRAMITPGIKDTQCGAKFARQDVWESILRSMEEKAFAGTRKSWP